MVIVVLWFGTLMGGEDAGAMYSAPTGWAPGNTGDAYKKWCGSCGLSFWFLMVRLVLLYWAANKKRRRRTLGAGRLLCWGIGRGLSLDGAGDVAKAVGYRLAGACCPHYEDDEAYQGDEVDKPPAAGLAYVVHTAP